MQPLVAQQACRQRKKTTGNPWVSSLIAVAGTVLALGESTRARSPTPWPVSLHVWLSCRVSAAASALQVERLSHVGDRRTRRRLALVAGKGICDYGLAKVARLRFGRCWRSRCYGDRRRGEDSRGGLRQGGLWGLWRCGQECRSQSSVLRLKTTQRSSRALKLVAGGVWGWGFPRHCATQSENAGICGTDQNIISAAFDHPRIATTGVILPF